nr:thioredoxin-like protein YLS8 [Tanacetum cinerariifolium]
MSYLLPHLHNGWAVDQAILAEEERLVVIRFGHDWDETCMQMDEVLSSVADTLKNFAVIYLVDITEEFIDIVETVYRGARKGRGLVIAPKDYSTKYRY